MEFVGLDNKLNSCKEYSPRSIGILGMGRIGEALLTRLVESSKDLGINKISIGYRSKDKEKIEGIIDQVSPISVNMKIDKFDDIYSFGKNSDIIVFLIGKNEEIKDKREGLTGRYFREIKDLMEKLEESNPTILMVTNPVTSNCLVARLYSKQERPNIIGFTRIDYIRARHILTNWLREEFNKDIQYENVEVDVLGPHGKGLLVTNLRIGERGKRKNIYDNQELSLFFEDYKNRIEDLSNLTSEYGERTYKRTYPKGTPSLFALQISETLSRMIKGGKDTSAIDIHLDDMCRSSLKLPRGPVYASVPVIYKGGIPVISYDFDLERIPDYYRMKLLKTFISEEKRIKNYLINHKNGFSKLREHFEL